jgi:hypothetical protein
MTHQGGRRTRPRRTPAAVTTAVVVAAIRALGEPTAAEIAAAIARAGGVTVSGRAIRFLAEGAGAAHAVDAGGARRYRMPEAASS